MRIVMMATGDIAIPSFHSLLATGELVGLITQPDRPVGRHQTLTPPRIKVCAQEAGIPVFQPERMRDEEAVQGLIKEEQGAETTVPEAVQVATENVQTSQGTAEAAKGEAVTVELEGGETLTFREAISARLSKIFIITISLI